MVLKVIAIVVFQAPLCLSGTPTGAGRPPSHRRRAVSGLYLPARSAPAPTKHYFPASALDPTPTHAPTSTPASAHVFAPAPSLAPTPASSLVSFLT